MHWIHQLWRDLGQPEPVDGRGAEVGRRPTPGTHCALTGEASPRYSLRDALSVNFWPSRLGDVLPFVNGSSIEVSSKRSEPALSAAAVWAIRSVAFRAATWIYSSGAVEFCPTRHFPTGKKAKVPLETLAAAYDGRTCSSFLAWLLQDRPAGTVAAIPSYGIAHGGESNFHRLLWPSGATSDQLYKLQAKHTVLSASPSTRHGFLRLQVDNQLTLTIDCALWRALLADAHETIGRLRSMLPQKMAFWGIAKSVLLAGPGAATSHAPEVAIEVLRFHERTITDTPTWALLAPLLYEDSL